MGVETAGMGVETVVMVATLEILLSGSGWADEEEDGGSLPISKERLNLPGLTAGDDDDDDSMLPMVDAALLSCDCDCEWSAPVPLDDAVDATEDAVEPGS